MPFYPPKISARSGSPENAGKLRGANAVGTTASFECGSFVRFSLEIENEAKAIRQARFQTNGCGYMIASAEAAAAMLKGRDLTDLHGLAADQYGWLIAEQLGEFPPHRKQCADLVFNALKDALADYRGRLLDDFSGEKALICTCFGVMVETVETYIDANAPVSVDNVTESCRAGGGCGSCRMLIQELIESRNFELASDSNGSTAASSDTE